MSEMTVPGYQRQIDDVTRDIYIHTGQFLREAIEIGRLLFEAKDMVEPGGWAKYIEEKLPFSHSWANNYMKLYKGYGSDQTSLFGDSQAFMNLRPTQALELLRLPPEERQAFVEDHDVADMSTRQLHQAVQDELAQTKEKLSDAEKRADEAEERAADAEAALTGAEKNRDRAKNEAEKAVQKAAQDKERAEKSEKVALDLVKKLEKQLADAEAREKTALSDLQKARENPDIPDDVMAAMRQEAEREATKKATEDIQAQLDAARQAAAKAEQEKTAAEEAARVAAAKLEEVQKTSKLNNPDMMAIQTLVENMMATWNTIQGHRMKAVAANPDNAKPLRGFLEKVLDNMSAALGE